MTSMDNLQWRQVAWQVRETDHSPGRTVHIDVLTNHQAPDVYLYAGLGEERRATAAGVVVLGNLGLRAAGVVLPFHQLPATRANIERTCNEAPIAVARTLNEYAERPADTPVNLIGKSQGGGVVLLTGRAAPEQYGAIGALAPIGLNRAFLGENTSHQRHVFLRRLLIDNNLRRDQNPFVDKGNWLAALEIGNRAIRDTLARRLTPKIDYAMEHEFERDIARLKLDHPIRVFIGENDPLFKATELSHSLGLADCSELLEIIPGSHCSLLTRMGVTQLQTVGRWLASVT